MSSHPKCRIRKWIIVSEFHRTSYGSFHPVLALKRGSSCGEKRPVGSTWPLVSDSDPRFFSPGNGLSFPLLVIEKGECGESGCAEPSLRQQALRFPREADARVSERKTGEEASLSGTCKDSSTVRGLGIVRRLNWLLFSQKPNLNLLHTGNYLHSIYVVFTAVLMTFTLFKVSFFSCLFFKLEDNCFTMLC